MKTDILHMRVENLKCGTKFVGAFVILRKRVFVRTEPVHSTETRGCGAIRGSIPDGAGVVRGG